MDLRTGQFIESMKVISIQPGSLYQNGGAARVLRRLYLGREEQIHAVGIVESATPAPKGMIRETLVPTAIQQRKWLRWYLRNFMVFLRDSVLKSFTKRKIRKILHAESYDVVHLVSHGPFNPILKDTSFGATQQLWVSFHDHFSTAGSSKADTNLLWNKAHRRLVISDELGKHYQSLFGAKPFELITDGLFENEISPSHSMTKANNSLIVYFAGLLHIDYYPLFQALADALDLLVLQKKHIKLILRGTQPLGFLSERSFEVEYRKDFVSDQEIKTEMDAASILYLPIKFTEPNFYLYSLSTKMIGYLGASGTILYHGPGNSAAAKLLNASSAGICCDSLDPADVLRSLEEIFAAGSKVSEQAKHLAKTRFDFPAIQDTFWQGKTVEAVAG